MQTRIQWNSTYSINHPKIDKQHQAIFKLIDDIPNYLSVGTIKECIMNLYDYTGSHFTDEEKMMHSIGYPDLKAHQKLHGDLISKLMYFSKHNFVDQASLDEFKEFTYNWLVEHILQEDMKYKTFVVENKISWKESAPN